MVSSSRFNTFLILFPSSSITNSDILLNWKNTHFMVGVCVFFFTWFLIASFASSNLVLSFHSAIEYNNKHRTITIASAFILDSFFRYTSDTVSYTHLRAHETDSYLVCRLLLEKKKKKN